MNTATIKRALKQAEDLYSTLHEELAGTDSDLLFQVGEICDDLRLMKSAVEKVRKENQAI